MRMKTQRFSRRPRTVRSLSYYIICTHSWHLCLIYCNVIPASKSSYYIVLMTTQYRSMVKIINPKYKIVHRCDIFTMLYPVFVVLRLPVQPCTLIQHATSFLHALHTATARNPLSARPARCYSTQPPSCTLCTLLQHATPFLHALHTATARNPLSARSAHCYRTQPPFCTPYTLLQHATSFLHALHTATARNPLSARPTHCYMQHATPFLHALHIATARNPLPTRPARCYSTQPPS